MKMATLERTRREIDRLLRAPENETKYDREIARMIGRRCSKGLVKKRREALTAEGVLKGDARADAPFRLRFYKANATIRAGWVSDGRGGEKPAGEPAGDAGHAAPKPAAGDAVVSEAVEAERGFPLTDMHRKVLRYWRNHQWRYGVAPALQECAVLLGTDANAVGRLVSDLAYAGLMVELGDRTSIYRPTSRKYAAKPELVAKLVGFKRPTWDSQMRLTTTAPVELTCREYERWLHERLSKLYEMMGESL